MLHICPPKLRASREPIARPTLAPPPPPVAPVLVMAAFDQEAFTLLLRFELPTDFAGLNGSVISVSDALFTGASWVATGDVDVIDDRSVSIGMVQTGPPTGSGQELTAIEDNGIVPVDGGPEWVGVDGLELPFGL